MNPGGTSLPVFSILIRTIGRSEELAAALDSVAAQTLAPERFEVVLVNDGGPSIVGLADAASRSFDLHLVEMEERRGKSEAINSGFERSRGRFICILDDDDLYYPSHLEVLQTAVGCHPDAPVLYTDTDVALADEGGQHRIIGNQIWEFDRSELLMMRKAPIACSMCIRRDAWSAVGGFDEQFTRVLDDWDFYMRLSEQFSFHRVPQTTSRYTQPPSSKTFRRFPSFEAGLDRIRHKLEGTTATLKTEVALDSALDRLRRDYTIAVREFEIEELRNQAGGMPQSVRLTDPLMAVALCGPDPGPVQVLSATTFTVEIGNRGTETWGSSGGPYPIRLSYHWMNEDGTPHVWEGLRTPLPRDVLPGRTLVGRVLVHTPELPGVYYWRPAVVQEGAQWIPDASDPVTQFLVRVTG
jgi:hypothetical protein